MSALHRLAHEHGIARSYHDIWGHAHDVPDETLRALLASIGLDVSSDASAAAALTARERAQWHARTPPLVVLRERDCNWRLTVRAPADVDASRLRIRVDREDGSSETHTVTASVRREATFEGERWLELVVELPVRAACGYHDVAVESDREDVAAMRLAVTPSRCYRPPEIANGGRTFGAAVQLYGVRSHRNWGIGDFGDLAGLCERWGAQGAGIVGVNPLHALFSHNPSHASPYSPSSRLFVNALYLDVEAMPDFAECVAARRHVASDGFQSLLRDLRESDEVDYPRVAQAKRMVLDMLFASFRTRHCKRRTSRAATFEAFRRDGGEALALYALFEALQEHWFARDAAVWGWPAWPEPYRHPESAAVATFASERRDRVDFFAYLQWQADLQRADAARRGRDAGLAIGVYTDLAVSIDRGGAESWAHQDLYADGASVGAPPDAFNLDGQDWGLPPIVPSRLVDAGFAPLIATLRANMRHAGALRIDHVMGLMRLFWVPPGGTPANGTYVHYPFADEMALLALESQRNRCLVIGEDLGTVPDEVRRTLSGHDVLSYRVLLFERDDRGAFHPPSHYPEAALATASTHDLPTLVGWWEGHDIDVRASLGLIDASERDRQKEERAGEREKLVDALFTAGVLGDVEPRQWIAGAMTPALAEAVQRFLAGTPSALMIVQLEDALFVREQANLPGTIDEHPNWRRKLPEPIESAFDTPRFVALARALAGRRSAAPR